ncbi:beta-1,3-galactosyltransferase 5-like [Oratosquilla oratoria]|uniref:beta-1,3-galactosyltransferase 5-like n=1 Tax=Oratosquilla oratoria TaxID=337810 RepID=UPI003F7657F0
MTRISLKVALLESCITGLSKIRMVPPCFRGIFQPVGMLLCLSTLVFISIGVWEDWLSPRRLATPNPLSHSHLYPSNVPLYNLPDFKYILNNNMCDKERVFGVIIVHSHPANREMRDVMRKHISATDLHDMGLRRVFLLARAEWDDQTSYKKTPQVNLEDEDLQNHDIVQGNFKEHYHNLTYKHTMGLQWVTKYCPQAKFIIKMDDDIVVDLFQFRHMLMSRYKERDNLILGLVQYQAKPVRNKESKWYVTDEEYPAMFYPIFASGWVYAMTLDAAKKIVAESFKVPYFWIDDVFITGILAERVGVKREGANRFYTLHVDHLLCCVELPNHNDYYCDFFVGPSEHKPEVMAKLLSHARYCYMHSCERRSPEYSIAKKCVRTQARPLVPAGVGKPEVVVIH